MGVILKPSHYVNIKIGVKARKLSKLKTGDNGNIIVKLSTQLLKYSAHAVARILSYLNVCIKHNHSLLKMGKKQTSHIHQSNCVGTFSTKMPRMKDWTANGSSDSHESLVGYSGAFTTIKQRCRWKMLQLSDLISTPFFLLHSLMHISHSKDWWEKLLYVISDRALEQFYKGETYKSNQLSCIQTK